MTRNGGPFRWFAGALAVACLAGGLAWVRFGNTACEGREAGTDGKTEAERAEGRGEAPVQESGIREQLDRIERRLERIETRLREAGSARSPSRERPETRCSRLRKAFVFSGEVLDGLPVYNPTRDGYWQRIGRDPSLHPEIKRYRLRWFGGKWSPWYIPGKNDFDAKTNLDGSQRLMWACFTDHSFQAEFDPALPDRCLIRRNPFVETGRFLDGLPVYRPTGDEYWERIGAAASLHPEIERYRILEPGSGPSRWYVPGENDADGETAAGEPARLMWSRFTSCEFQVAFR